EGLREVAALCVGLGEEVAGRVLCHLSEYEVQEVALAVAGLESADPQTVERQLGELQQHLLTQARTGTGGAPFARALLQKTLGPSSRTLALELQVAGRARSGFPLLAKAAPDRLAPFISHEHPQTIALILSQLEPAQAAGILALLPEGWHADVAYRIATLDNVPPMVLGQLGESLEDCLREVLGRSEAVGGPKATADILNLSGASVERRVLEGMDAHDPGVAEAVRNLMFVFEDIAGMSDRDIQRLLREVEQQDLVVALKGATPGLRERFLTNISEQVKEWLRDQDAFLGRMRLDEVEEVQLRIVQQVRQLEEQGELTIVRGDPAARLV
ncbi:MAG: flagellar motor switch protein FliG, partial [Candidatus Latescibacterota bacterium]